MIKQDQLVTIPMLRLIGLEGSLLRFFEKSKLFPMTYNNFTKIKGGLFPDIILLMLNMSTFTKEGLPVEIQYPSTGPEGKDPLEIKCVEHFNKEDMTDTHYIGWMGDPAINNSLRTVYRRKDGIAVQCSVISTDENGDKIAIKLNETTFDPKTDVMVKTKIFETTQKEDVIVPTGLAGIIRYTYMDDGSNRISSIKHGYCMDFVSNHVSSIKQESYLENQPDTDTAEKPYMMNVAEKHYYDGDRDVPNRIELFDEGEISQVTHYTSVKVNGNYFTTRIVTEDRQDKEAENVEYNYRYLCTSFGKIVRWDNISEDGNFVELINAEDLDLNPMI